MTYRSDRRPFRVVRWMTAAEASQLAGEIRRSVARRGWLVVRVVRDPDGAVGVVVESRMSGVVVRLESRDDWDWLKRAVVKG